MKNSRLMRLAALLLVFTLATACFVGGTFAKYTSEFSGTSNARVAKWAFTVDETAVDLTTEKTFAFDVFGSEYTDGNVDTDGNGSEHVIAPGTTGNITVQLKNASEVNAQYRVAYTANEAGVPLQWSTDGDDWADDITEFNIGDTNINMDGTANITLYWKWAFVDDDVVTQSDTDDTALGIAGTAAPTVTATVTVTQVD